MKKYDQASSEYQRLIHQYPNNYLIEQAKWYIDDINWWKLWYEKNASNNNQLSTAGNGGETR
jgi:TolA-binding protein